MSIPSPTPTPTTTAPADPFTEERRQLAMTFMTTEHFTLQSARGITVSESTSRASLYIGTLSSSLVALGFAAQASSFGHAFLVFAILILPPVAFLGLITFERTVQSGLEDAHYARGIGRVRRFYAELVPEARPYFVEPVSDASGPVTQGTMRHAGWQILLTIGSMVGITNSAVAGAAVGVAVTLVFDASLGVALTTGTVVAGVAAIAHVRYQQQRWQDAGRSFTPMFPNGGPTA